MPQGQTTDGPGHQAGAGSERSRVGTSTDGVRSKMPQRRQALGLHTRLQCNEESELRAWAERELDGMTP